MNRLAKLAVELGLDRDIDARLARVREDMADWGEALAATGKALTAGLTKPIVEAVADPDEGESD